MKVKVSSTLAKAAPTGHQSALTHSLGGAFYAPRRGAPLRPGFAGAAAGQCSTRFIQITQYRSCSINAVSFAVKALAASRGPEKSALIMM